MTEKLFDDFNIPSDSWRLDESEASQSMVDGVNIIGRAVGPFFLVDGESKNKRFYSKSLWEKALNESKDSIDSGQMLGTIGHQQVLDDAAILDGKVSHTISKLWIDESKKIGMGEVLIFNTPAGQILNSMLRGKVKLAVSSRAFGELKGKTQSGASVVDPNTFKLECFDFVRNPGITIATPQIVESNNYEEENLMNDQILETLAKDKAVLQSQLTEALDKISSLNANILSVKADQVNDKLTAKIEALTESLKSYSKFGSESEVKSAITDQSSFLKIKDDFDQYKTLGSPLEVKRLIESYTTLGTPSDIKSALSDAAETIKNIACKNSEPKVNEEYNDLGSPSEIKKLINITEKYMEACSLEELNEMISLMENYSELGSPDEISHLMDLVENHFSTVKNSPEKSNDVNEEYLELGSPAEISKVLDLTESYISLGTPDEISKIFDITESFSSLGSSEDLSKVLDIFENMLAEHGTPEDLAELESVTEEYVSYGTLEELKTIFDLMEQYSELGSPEQIRTAFELAEDMVNKSKTEKLHAEALEVADQYGVKSDVVESLIRKLGKDEAVNTLDEMIESKNFSTRYRKAEKLNESSAELNEESLVSQTRISRLFSNLGR